MADPTKAIFLSYAREDAAAAHRIAEALRGFGVEVWFDQSELRGGDQWDEKIRGQIKACALFIPVISATTQSRDEAYFRLEWKLADDRSHLMAAGKTFIVPVVIDDTPEAGAMVPDSFSRSQWTRLPGGEPSTAFIEQVKRLLDAPRKPALKPDLPRPPTLPPEFKQAAQARAEAAAAARPPAVPGWMWGVLVVVIAVAVAGMIFLRRPETPAPPPVAAAKAAAPAAPAVSDKSIAVLPFTNMSEDKDSGYFADGVHEDVLTNLALVRELRVVSRTSVEAYRGTIKPMKQIAAELGVTYILEGSVRRVGNKVRVTGQLIHAATDEHVWAQAYDRDLTDIFAIQSELSKAIAGELQAALSPAETAQVERHPTLDMEAYDLFLRARDRLNRMGAIAKEDGLKESIGLLQRAVERDPGFYRAWASLANAHSVMIELGYDMSEARRLAALTAAEQVAKRAPDSPEAHGARGLYHYVLRDYASAYEENEWQLARYPRDAEAVCTRGLIQRRWGRWGEALATLRRAQELDPANINIVQNLALHCWEMRRYAEARVAYRRLAELRPEEMENVRMPAGLGTLDYLERGSTAEGDAYFAALGPAELAAPEMIERRRNWVLLKGDYATFEKLATERPDVFVLLTEAMLLSTRHAAQPAVEAKLRPVMAQMQAELQRESGNWSKYLILANAEAIAGDRAAALRDADKALALMPIANDAFYGGNARYFAGVVWAWTGDRDRALAELAERLRTPPAVSIHAVRCAPEWWPLHGDPRFEALVNDPKNNAPLF